MPGRQASSGVLDQRLSQFGDRPIRAPEEAPRQTPLPDTPVSAEPVELGAPTPPAAAGKSWGEVLVAHWLVLLLRWLERVLRALDADAARHPSTSPNRLTNAPHRFFTAE